MHRIISALTWKAGVTIAAAALVAGTGATSFHLVNDSHPAGEHDDVTTTVGQDLDADTDQQGENEDGDSQGDNGTVDADGDGHPDNHGEIVSEAAHARNDARHAGAAHASETDEGETDEIEVDEIEVDEVETDTDEGDEIETDEVETDTEQ